MSDNTRKRKILQDRNFPTSEQINSHQDFKRLQSDHALIKKIMMKKIMLWGGAIACAGAVGVAALLVLTKPATKTTEAKQQQALVDTKAKTTVLPPVAGQEVPFSTYRISAKNGGVINYPTGSSITIPANAFVNANGSPVAGDSIEIRYREFHNPLDIFRSGIPMRYDSAGISRTLESAGMLQILAFDNGVNVTINEQSPIQIKMASANADERFNLYELDTITGNWLYTGKDKVEPIAEKQDFHKTRTMQENAETTDHTVKPALANPQSYSFKIGYDKNEFPELAAYNNVLFEVADNNFKPAYYRINWNKIMLYSGDAPGVYIVKLKKADTSISVTAKPVFDKAHYADALSAFEARHKTASSERDEKEFEKQAAVNKVNATLKGHKSKDMVQVATSMARLSTYRSFVITRTGFHNCDYPLPPIIQYAYAIKKVTATNIKDLAYNTIFLVEKGKNTVFRFSKGEPVRCNPKAKNLMWTVTDNNEIAFFRISDYNTLVNGGSNAIAPVVAQNQDVAFNEIKTFSE